jgi:hypothetical protein
MHTFLVIDFWLLIAALVFAFVLSLRTHAWRKP